MSSAKSYSPSDFHYGGIVAKDRPSGLGRFWGPEQEKLCACGVTFRTACRERVRCDACRAKRQKLKSDQANARNKAKRKARKEFAEITANAHNAAAF